jgi:type I restriction-modification system DNA methylase subunit
MSAPAELLGLIERFEQQLDSYKSGAYNEAQLRIEFLDPFFKLLGWDMDNTAGYAEAYKDVIHEDAIRIGDQSKAPDYCFRIGGTRKFFLEAKKPSVFIKEEIPPAYQLRSYAWSAKLPLSILSDFEEFAFYDCRVKPKNDDSAAVARIFYCTFRDYADKWDEIAAIFSREAILKGSFDKFVESTKAKKGTAEFDQDFLATIEGWRKELAQNLALRNPKLTQRQLNFAVQRIIDRIIFLRICEARAIEDYGRLRSLVNGDGIYPRLAKLFEDADTRYNSGLFHFKKEAGRHEAPDELTLELHVDDKLLRNIIRGLYYPESPYHFSVVSADILGQVYEQFLGKVIRLTPGHHAVIEDKPEVKKAGGVYYTPTYIVDYIVQQTVGKLVEGKTAKQVEKIRILDPACGSGSFLIGAYQYLLDWHLQFYTASDPAKFAKGGKPALVQTTGGWKLTIAERKRILLNNIYGVDIDGQAVEVTKLSLLLKVLEGETSQSLQSLFTFFHERALPDLGDNIKCGNSLIGPDFYQQSELPLLTDEERYRINVFDWRGKDGFPEIMHGGGFDAVIGNPPYGASLTTVETNYLRECFKTATKDLDTYVLFIEQSLDLAKRGGRVAMIVPTGWYSGPKFSMLRRHIAVSSDPLRFVNLPYDVFRAWVDTTVFCVAKRAKPTQWPRKDSLSVSIRTFPKRHRVKRVVEFDEDVRQANFAEWFSTGSDEFLTYADSQSTSLIAKVLARSKPLGQMADVQRGVTPFNLTSTPTFAASRSAFNGTVRRYRFDPGEVSFIRFDDTLAEPKPERYFLGPRLLLRELISRQFQLQAVKVTDDFVTNKSMQSVLKVEGGPELSYLLGILNSRLLSWYFLRRSNVAQRDDFPKIVLKETRSLPVRPIDLSNKSDRAVHDRMVSFVDSILELHRKLPIAKTPQEKTALEREIAATDARIDRLVYDLYGLTEDEIKIVEGTAISEPPPAEPTEGLTKPKRAKSAYAAPPPAPVDASLTPEKAHGDAAHYYSGKEDPLPYRINSSEEKKGEP